MIANRSGGFVPWFLISSRFHPAPTANSNRLAEHVDARDFLSADDRVALGQLADRGSQADPRLPFAASVSATNGSSVRQ